jgi:hypothetical protein
VEFAVFTYEGEIFPGERVQVNKYGAISKVMQKSYNAWKWSQQDELFVYAQCNQLGDVNPPVTERHVLEYAWCDVFGCINQ